jgi:hypothetical protein
LKKIKILFEFYKSTFLFSLEFFLLLLYFLNINSDSTILNLTPFAYLYGSIFGLLTVLFIKEVNKNNDYLFYFNSNLSKLQLYGYSLVVNLLISLILRLMFR